MRPTKPPTSMADRYSEVPPEVRNFLERLEPEDIDVLALQIRKYRDRPEDYEYLERMTRFMRSAELMGSSIKWLVIIIAACLLALHPLLDTFKWMFSKGGNGTQ